MLTVIDKVPGAVLLNLKMNVLNWRDLRDAFKKATYLASPPLSYLSHYILETNLQHKDQTHKQCLRWSSGREPSWVHLGCVGFEVTGWAATCFP